MSYQRERGECIATLTRYGLDYRAIETLLRAATTINRLAELACSSEEADRDRIKCPASWVYRKPGPCLCDYDAKAGSHTSIPRIRLQDWQAEQRARRALPEGWALLTSGDPRGYTLRVIPPAFVEENKTRSEHDPRSIGVPPGPSRLRW